MWVTIALWAFLLFALWLCFMMLYSLIIVYMAWRYAWWNRDSFMRKRRFFWYIDKVVDELVMGSHRTLFHKIMHVGYCIILWPINIVTWFR